MSGGEAQRPPARSVPAFQHSRALSYLKELARAHAYPVTVMIGLTHACNLRCEHCLLGEVDPRSQLTGAELEVLLDDLAAAGTLILGLTGGEPALRHDLEDIVRAAVHRGFLVRLKSNAALLDDHRVDRLHAAGLRYLETSLYHDDPAQHDAFVGAEGAFERTLAAARRFVDRGGYSLVTVVSMGWNSERVGPLIDLCQAQGFSYTVSPTVYCRNDGSTDNAHLRCDEGAAASFLSDPRVVDAAALPMLEARSADDSECAAGRDQPFIAPNGDVQLCQRLPMVLGNLRERGFREIWDTSAQRKAFRERRWGGLPECGDCALSSVCWRCPASALLELGDVDARSPGDCVAARVVARLRRE